MSKSRYAQKIVMFYCRPCAEYHFKTHPHYRAMKRRAAKRCNAKAVVALIVALLLYPLTALAGKSDKLASCNIVANLARTIAEKRDEGVTSDEIRATMAGTKLPPGQKDMVEGLITIIYGDDSLTPDKAAAAALTGCMGDAEQ